ncbi:MAG TPA: MFS transporter [Clostridia bacterium]|nr:MFS transporter [Clostridia bacterium]
MVNKLKDLFDSHRNILVINVMALIAMMGIGVITPILPLYGKMFTVSNTAIGFLITVFGLARVIVDMPAGLMLDKWGRKGFLLGGLLTMSVSSLLCAMASSFWVLAFWRFIQGAGSAIYTTSAMTVVADLSNQKNRGQNMALYQGSILLGTGFGPAIGGATADYLSSYRAPFVLFAVLAFIGAVWVWKLIPETKRVNSYFNGSNKGKISVWASLGNINLIMVSLINFNIFFARAGIKFDLLPLAGVEKFSLSPTGIGFVLSVSALATVLVLPLAGWLSDRIGRKMLIVPSNIMAGLSMVIFAYCESYSLFLFGAIFYGVSVGLGGVIASAYVADVVPQRFYGTAMGFFRALGDVGFVIAPVLLGFMLDRSGFKSAFLLSAFATFAITAIFGFFTRGQEGQEADGKSH